MENEVVTPLTDEEIKDGIAHKVAVAVREALDRYGPMYTKSYPKFLCVGTLKLVLDNFGLKAESNYAIVAGTLEPVGDVEAIEIPVEIPETPPNQFRRETEQSVPVRSMEQGKPVDRAVFYQAKRKRT